MRKTGDLPASSTTPSLSTHAPSWGQSSQVMLDPSLSSPVPSVEWQRTWPSIRMSLLISNKVADSAPRTDVTRSSSLPGQKLSLAGPTSYKGRATMAKASLDMRRRTLHAPSARIVCVTHSKRPRICVREEEEVIHERRPGMGYTTGGTNTPYNFT